MHCAAGVAGYFSIQRRRKVSLPDLWTPFYNAAMPRHRVWIESQSFQGFGCSECDWVFKPFGALVGETLEEMKRKFEAQWDKEFAAHVCLKPGRATIPKTD